jgi:O-antigen/teichoic acid export membrane protein
MRWRIIFRNIASNWASYCTTALVGFFLAPKVVHGLGTTGYGMWTLVLSLTGYFGLFDLGIRSSVGRFVARYLALNDEARVNRTVSTAFAMLGAGGLATFTGCALVSRFFLGSFHIEPQFLPVVQAALLLTGFNMALALPLGVFSSVLVALERYDILSVITIISELLRAALVLLALHAGKGLLTLAAIAVCLSITQYSVMFLFARRLYRPLAVRPRFVDRATLKELFGFSIFRFISIVAVQMIFYSDSVVVGFFLGVAMVTYYAIASTLINYARNIVSVVTDTLYPLATRLDARRDEEGLRELLLLGTKLAVTVALPISVGFLFLGKQFIGLWMGPQYVSSATFLMVLTIPQAAAMSQYASTLVLAGMAKHRVLAYVALCEGVANLALSSFLVRKIGLIGVAWGMAVPDLICMSIIVPWYTLRTVGMSPRKYLARAYAGPLASALPAAAVAYALATFVSRPTLPIFAAEAAAVGGTFALAAFFLCLNSGQRSMLLRRVRNRVSPELAVAQSR